MMAAATRKICQVADKLNTDMGSGLSHYRPQLESSPWFRDLPGDLRDGLMRHATLLRLGKGEALYRRGDPDAGLYAVVEGALAISTAGVDGKEFLLAVLGPTAWLGEVSLFDGLPRSHDAIAASRSVVLHVPEAALRSLLDATPRYWRDMARLIEVAAMDEKLKGLGQNAAVDFNTRLLRLMEQNLAT